MVRVVVCDGLLQQAFATALGGPAAACDGRALQADEIASGPPETSEAEVDAAAEKSGLDETAPGPPETSKDEPETSEDAVDAVAENGLPEKGLATVPEEESQEDGRASGVGASFQ